MVNENVSRRAPNSFSGNANLVSGKKGIYPTGILFLQRMNTYPFTREHCQEVAILRQLCGDNFLPNVVIVTTMTSDPEQEDEWVEALSKNVVYWEPLLRRGANQKRLSNTSSSAIDILGHFRGKRPEVLRIHVEMRRYQADIKCSSAWYTMEDETSQDGLEGKGKGKTSKRMWRLRRLYMSLLDSGAWPKPVRGGPRDGLVSCASDVGVELASVVITSNEDVTQGKKLSKRRRQSAA